MKVKEKIHEMMEKDLKIQEDLETIKQESQLEKARLNLEITQKLLREEKDRTNEAQLWKHHNELRCSQVYF